MLRSFLKKEILLFLRNRQELIILVGMPFLLITILGFALGAVLDGDVQPINAKVALVVHSNEQEELQEFKDKLDASPMPDEIKSVLYTQSQQLLPVSMLKNNIFLDERMSQILTLDEISFSQMEKVKKEGEYAAIIEVPEGFTSSILQTLFIQKQSVPELKVYVNEGKELSANIVEDIMKIFRDQYSVMSAVGMEMQGEVQVPDITVEPKVETVNKAEPIGAFSYYSVGMSVMFVLYIASTMSSHSFMENKNHVFNRIILANVPSLMYIVSVFCTTVMLAFIQVGILYSGAALFYRVHWPDFIAFVSVTLALSMAVGGIAVFLSALNHRYRTNAASKIFMNVFVTILSFVGGSFIPVGNMSEVMERIGKLTPNGAAMAAYLDVLQGEGLLGVINHIGALSILAIIFFVIAWLIFPRRVGTV